MANWLLGHLRRTTVTSTVGASTITRVSSFDYDSVTGILKQEVIEPDATDCNSGTASCRLQTDYTLDPFGHRQAATVSGAGIPSRGSQAGYDANGALQTSATNAKNQGETWDYTDSYGRGIALRSDLPCRYRRSDHAMEL